MEIERDISIDDNLTKEIYGILGKRERKQEVYGNNLNKKFCNPQQLYKLKNTIMTIKLTKEL